MELTGQERFELMVALTKAFPSYEDLRTMVAAELNENLNTVTPHNGKLDTVAFSLVEWADSRGRIDDLIEGALRQNGGNPVLNATTVKIRQALQDRRTTTWYVSPDPAQTHVLNQRQVLIDRKPLRSAVANLASPQGYRLLAVHGEPVSGKSYSLQYIMFQCDRLNHIRVASIDLNDNIHTQFSPSDLVRQIALQMSVSIETIPAQQAQAAKWVQELGAWVVGQAQKSDLPWWIVLDGFDTPALPAETRDMIYELQVRAAGNATKLRLILLSYQEEMTPLRLRRRVKKEDLKKLTEEDIREFFARLFDARKQATGEDYDPLAIDDVVQAVMLKSAPYAQDPEYLVYLTGHAEEMVHALFFEDEE